MQDEAQTSPEPGRYTLFFRSILLAGRGYAFPCNAEGRVELQAMSVRLRQNYLYAKARVGLELLSPVVEVDGGRLIQR